MLDRARRGVQYYDGNGKEARFLQPSSPLTMSGSASALTVGANGLYIWDPGKMQVLGLKEDGDVNVLPMLGSPSHTFPSVFQAGVHNTLVAGTRSPNPAKTFFQEFVVLLDSGGNVTSTLGPFPSPTTRIRSADGLVATVRLADDLADRMVWVQLRDGRIIGGRSGGVSIADLRAPSKPLVTLSPRRLPVGDDDRDAALSMAGTTNFDSAGIRAMLPRMKSELVELVAGDRWLFVRRPTPGNHLHQLVYDIVELASLSYCATVKVESRLLASDGDRVAGLGFSSEGQIMARVYQVRNAKP